FWVQAVQKQRVHLLFQGGVGLAHAQARTPICFFRRGQHKAIGRGRLVAAKGTQGRLESATARLTKGVAESGGYAMWDFPGFSIHQNKIVTRCCDDLLGAAAALCVLDELALTRPSKTQVMALFTRGEELGFYGALWAVKHGLLPKTARVLSLECSRALPK